MISDKCVEDPPTLRPISLLTFVHEERLASENPAGHSDTSWSELWIFQAIVPAHLGQQL